MASFPSSIYSPRTMVNRTGVVYDEDKTKVIYAEDFNKDRDEIVAIETVLLNGGWLPISTIPTLQASDNPVYTLRFASDMTGIIGLGQKIKLTQNGTVKYFIVVKVGAYTGGNTDVDVYGGTDYDMENTGTYPVTLPYNSVQKAPFGFPLNPEKWTELVESTTRFTQNTPTANVFYSDTNLDISIPIGLWNVEQRVLYLARSDAAEGYTSKIAFSEADDAISDVNYGSYIKHYAAGSGSAYDYFHKIINTGLVSLTAKTTFYTIIMVSPSCTYIANLSDLDIGYIKAVCAYL